MAVRDIVRIDEDLCDGCGDCVPTCAEGAIQIIEGKARLVGDALCDGLGACLGHCPQGAITVERRQADAFDERAVEAHLARMNRPPAVAACPSLRPTLLPVAQSSDSVGGPLSAAGLRQWPVQLHLLQPSAPFLAGADVVLAADCVAFAAPDFHRQILAGRALAIACPKLDHSQESYAAKLVSMVDDAEIRSLEVVVMEVPCCGGLVSLAQAALARARRRPTLTVTIVSIRGEMLGRQVKPAV